MPESIENFLILGFTVRTAKAGSVRVDLLGGTLDIYPINLVLSNVITLNMATGLQAKVSIEDIDESELVLVSDDYKTTKKFSLNELYNLDDNLERFEQFEFVARIIRFVSPSSGLRVTLSSGAPPGSGLGGSSAMGAVLFSALSEHFDKHFKNEKVVSIVQNIESKILNAGPAGYQDYYPSLFGGVLALKATYSGVFVEQLFSTSLTHFLQENVRLIYSGESRKSGINNWEVYKSFFDGDEVVRDGLSEINSLSNKAYTSIKNEDYAALLSFIRDEGAIRERLFPSILTDKMKRFKADLFEKFPLAGMKICGAGGGGCFIITNVDSNIRELLEKYSMKELPFEVNNPTERSS